MEELNCSKVYSLPFLSCSTVHNAMRSLHGNHHVFFPCWRRKKLLKKKLEKREVGEIKIFYNSRFFVNSAGFTLPLIYEREKLALILLHFNNCCMFLLFTTIQQSSLSHPPRQPTPSTKIQYYSFFFLRSHRQHTILAGREQHRHWLKLVTIKAEKFMHV